MSLLFAKIGTLFVALPIASIVLGLYVFLREVDRAGDCSSFENCRG